MTGEDRCSPGFRLLYGFFTPTLEMSPVRGAHDRRCPMSRSHTHPLTLTQAMSRPVSVLTDLSTEVGGERVDLARIIPAACGLGLASFCFLLLAFCV